ncbi:MAG: uncharacterized protein A8A55_1385 [Amphiamblys sp. WSBS2006]|nr:MAG: uncharacterized protein A8A55_1385 [Amphiamblys sp. WSBS2006]
MFLRLLSLQREKHRVLSVCGFSEHIRWCTRQIQRLRKGKADCSVFEAERCFGWAMDRRKEGRPSVKRHWRGKLKRALAHAANIKGEPEKEVAFYKEYLRAHYLCGAGEFQDAFDAFTRVREGIQTGDKIFLEETELFRRYCSYSGGFSFIEDTKEEVPSSPALEEFFLKSFGEQVVRLGDNKSRWRLLKEAKELSLGFPELGVCVAFFVEAVQSLHRREEAEESIRKASLFLDSPSSLSSSIRSSLGRVQQELHRPSQPASGFSESGEVCFPHPLPPVFVGVELGTRKPAADVLSSVFRFLRLR